MMRPRTIDGHKLWLILTIFAMIVTFAMAIVMSLGQSVWFDENYSLLLAQRPVQEMIALTSVDAHPPFYYLFLKVWASVFGWSELALRSSSALFSAMTVGVMSVLIRKLFTARIALYTLPFIVLAPFLIRYSYEIRMYALVTFIGVLSTWVLVKAVGNKKIKWWVGYGVLVALGMYTLYMSVVFWLAHLVWLLIIDRQDKRHTLRKNFVVTYLAAVIVFIPWLPTVVNQLMNSALPGQVYAVTLIQLSNVLGMVTSYMADWQISAWLSVWLVVFMVLLVIGYQAAWRHSKRPQRQAILLLSLCFIVAIGFYALISLPPNPPRFMERYTVHVSVFAYALIGIISVMTWDAGKRRVAAALASLSLIMFVGGIVQLHSVGNYNFQRAQQPQTKQLLSSYGCDDDVTYVASGSFAYIDMYYDLCQCDVRLYEQTDPEFSKGYAPLHGLDKRITNTLKLSSKTLIVVHFDDSPQVPDVDSRYSLADERTIDKTYVQVYTLR